MGRKKDEAVELYIDKPSKTRFDREIVRNIQPSTLPAMRGEQDGRRGTRSRKPKARKETNRKTQARGTVPRKTEKSVRKVHKAIDQEKRYNRRLTKYLETLAHPFTATGIKTPVNYNPVPSMMTCVARTTYTGRITVANNSVSQFSIFPGHGSHLLGDTMDGFSYHSGVQAVGGTPNYFSIGPMVVGTFQCIIGTLTSLQPFDTSATASNFATSVPLIADVALPFTAVVNDPGHVRWKLVSMGMKLENTTPLATRGGFVTSVQVTSPFVAGTQKTYEIFPTYNVTEDANSGEYDISWIPRMDDIAFWHVADATAPSQQTSLAGAGMLVWVTSDAVSAQSYAFQIVANWEIAGSHVAAVSSAVIHQPADKNVLEPTMDVLRFGAHTAADAPSVAANIARTISPFAEHAGKIAGTFASAGLKSLMSNLV